MGDNSLGGRGGACGGGEEAMRRIPGPTRTAPSVDGPASPVIHNTSHPEARQRTVACVVPYN